MFVIVHIQAFIYLYDEKSSYGLQIKHSVWLLTILMEHLLTDNFSD